MNLMINARDAMGAHGVLSITTARTEDGMAQIAVGDTGGGFTEEALVENIRAFTDAVIKAKPSGAKGTFLKKIAVTSTMGPGIKIEPASAGGA